MTICPNQGAVLSGLEMRVPPKNVGGQAPTMRPLRPQVPAVVDGVASGVARCPVPPDAGPFAKEGQA